MATRQALASQLSEPHLIAAFSGVDPLSREDSRETSESGNGHVVLQNLKPECFSTPNIRRADSHCSYPSNDDTDCDSVFFSDGLVICRVVLPDVLMLTSQWAS